ncbi:hypothetical protein VC83_09633 [Pseudogymnoascus destructans]|uniref:Uncharacterized protein n=1 Tax=Pseudogymnoascus destructans TaxID=655981 RepID=A0A2P6FGJ7_9PEZI|nr:uncharacterized protein VC83_09633 [Pseudogymnoascus destructans]PQM43506.1 hypothetical protein VC83_09633 [Pseudogymnoascus destructans]
MRGCRRARRDNRCRRCRRDRGDRGDSRDRGDNRDRRDNRYRRDHRYRRKQDNPEHFYIRAQYDTMRSKWLRDEDNQRGDPYLSRRRRRVQPGQSTASYSTRSPISTLNVQYIPVSPISVLYSALHTNPILTMHKPCSITCLEAFQEKPKQSCPAVQPSSRRRSETMRIRSTPRAVQGPSAEPLVCPFYTTDN